MTGVQQLLDTGAGIKFFKKHHGQIQDLEFSNSGFKSQMYIVSYHLA